MKKILCGLIACTAATISVPGWADSSSREYTFELSRSTLRSALTEFSQQTGLQTFFSPATEAEENTVVGPLKGHYTAEAALNQLLSSTGLSFKKVNERTIALTAQGASTPSHQGERSESATKRVGEAKPDFLRLVDRRFGDEWADAASVERVATAEEGDAKTRQARSREEGRDTDQLEEILVTGTHIRGGLTTSPVLTLRREEIDRTGVSTVEGLMENLPQNFAEISPGGRFATEGGSVLAGTNNDRTSSVDLRGLGAQSTLTLLNGTRQAGSIGGRVFDISMLPLAMIERVDVVTGGHSAIYGSDAVGGVVNFITRREFSGAQTQVSYGEAHGDGERLQFSQLAGLRLSKGGLAVGYDYSREWPLDLADVGLLSTQPIPRAGNLRETSLQAQASSWRHSGFISGHYNWNDRIELYGDALYTYKRFEDEERQLRPGAASESTTRTTHPARQFGASGGAHVGLSEAWSLNASGTISESDIEARGTSFFDFGPSTSSRTFVRNDKATVSSVSAVVDGELPVADLGLRAAVGAEARHEEYRGSTISDGIPAPSSGRDREIQSAFAELVMPLVENGKSIVLRRFELSAAGRYDDYSDFGSTVNPQFGIMWEAAGGIRLRGGYSTAFRAPALAELANSNLAILGNAPDPKSATGTTPILVLAGDNPELGPEKADAWNISLEFQPASSPDANVSITYFNVKYRDRIAVPAVGLNNQLLALTTESRFSDLIDRNPTRTDAQAIVNRVGSRFFNRTGRPFSPASQNVLDVFPNLVTFDDRSNNISVDSVSGLDLIVKGLIPLSDGDITYGANVTYTLDHERSITETSPLFSLINEVGKPVDLRVRANLGLRVGSYGIFGYLNYTDGYSNPFSSPPSKLASWTTIDLTMTLDTTALTQSRLMHGLVGTLSVENLFDRDPPIYRSSAFGVLYDSTNANPFGRYVSLRVVKQW